MSLAKRIGVIIPSTNTMVESDYNDLRPDGVTFHIARIFINNQVGSDAKAEASLQQIRDGSAKAVHDVLTCRPDHLVMGMSSETFVGGLEGQRALTEKWEGESGLRVTTGSDATRMALETIDARKICVLTPYQPKLDGQVHKYFDDLGYEVVQMESLRCPTALSIAETTDEEILEKIDLMAGVESADAFVQAGTNLSTHKIAAAIEARTGRPHIAINAACVWHALGTLGLNPSLPSAGSVFKAPSSANV